jgi:hypothetical protein
LPARQAGAGAPAVGSTLHGRERPRRTRGVAGVNSIRLRLLLPLLAMLALSGILVGWVT